jgi:hypothetical protein
MFVSEIGWRKIGAVFFESFGEIVVGLFMLNYLVEQKKTLAYIIFRKMSFCSMYVCSLNQSIIAAQVAPTHQCLKSILGKDYNKSQH